MSAKSHRRLLPLGLRSMPAVFHMAFQSMRTRRFRKKENFDIPPASLPYTLKRNSTTSPSRMT